MAQLLILQQRLLGKLAQAFARFRSRHGAVIPQNERMADIVFKPLDLARQRGTADVHRTRRAPDVAAFSPLT